MQITNFLTTLPFVIIYSFVFSKKTNNITFEDFNSNNLSMHDISQLTEYYDHLAPKRDKWKKRNRLYHKVLEKYMSFIIPAGSKVIELGCGTGDLLNAVKPSEGTGIMNDIYFSSTLWYSRFLFFHLSLFGAR